MVRIYLIHTNTYIASGDDHPCVHFQLILQINNSPCKLLSMCTLDLAAVGFQFDFLVSPPQLTNHICSCNQQCKSSHKPGSVPSAKSWKPSKKRGEKWEFVESDWDVKSRSVCASLAFIRPPMAPLTAYGTYGLWHQLWLFTCGVTLVGRVPALEYCSRHVSEPLWQEHMTQLVSEWRGVFSVTLQP